jgi:hypothetical protein
VDGPRILVRKPLRIFHITPICNLPSIAKRKKLYSKTLLQKRNIGHGNIAYQGAQGKRATKLVAKPPGGVLHDYVPFYFAPRSPMLFTINKGNVPDCPHRQEDIVHLMTTVEAVIEAGLTYVFYDYNATLDFSTCYGDGKDLSKIDWELFHELPSLDGYCKYWLSNLNNPRYVLRMETRQAEFLIHKSVPLELITMIGTYDEAKAEAVREILDEAGIELPVEAKPDWYFNNQ